jgi:hypothetical protein
MLLFEESAQQHNTFITATGLIHSEEGATASLQPQEAEEMCLVT